MAVVADTGTWRKPPVPTTDDDLRQALMKSNGGQDGGMENPFGSLCKTDDEALSFVQSELEKFWGQDGQEHYCDWLLKREEELELRIEAKRAQEAKE